MAYNVPFSLNPRFSTSFDSSKKKIENLGQTGIAVSENRYVPTCYDSISNVKDNYRGMVENYAQNYGMEISYWSTGYDIQDSNKLYGENPTARYRGPRKIKAIIDFQSYSTFLTKWGVMSDLDIIIYIPIKDFQKVWGQVYPLAGDLFLIDDSSCDRPLGQSPIVFEITEKHDSINPADFMAGHYIWKIQAKRFDNSYEPGAPQEKFLGGPVDSKEYGKIESDIDQTDVNTSENNHDVDADAKDDFQTPNSSIYGKYF
jgi:hypothetical protein